MIKILPVLQYGIFTYEFCNIKPKASSMKLAETLGMLVDLQARIEQLKRRLKDSSKVQEGDEPAEDVNTLYKELNGLSCPTGRYKLSD